MKARRIKSGWIYSPAAPLVWIRIASSALDQAAATLCRNQWQSALLVNKPFPTTALRKSSRL